MNPKSGFTLEEVQKLNRLRTEYLAADEELQYALADLDLVKEKVKTAENEQCAMFLLIFNYGVELRIKGRKINIQELLSRNSDWDVSDDDYPPLSAVHES